MALFYLIRHGEPTYDHMLESGFWGFGRDFAPLTEKGKQQAEMTAKDICHVGMGLQSIGRYV